LIKSPQDSCYSHIVNHPLLDHRRVLILAWPMILSNISIPLLGLVDTAILGHLDSPTHLGAVAIGASILSFVFWGFGFLRMGTTSLVARAHGRHDKEASNTLLLQAGIVAVAIGVMLILLQSPLLKLALYLMGPPSSIAEPAAAYSSIRIYAAPAILLNLTLIGWFIGMQNTRAPLIMLVTTNAINIVLDAWFILLLGMGSNGAALASAIAECCGTMIGIYLVLNSHLLEASFINRQKIQQLAGYMALLKVNGHLFLRTALLLFTFAFFNSKSSQLGEATLAANAILFQLLLLVSYGLDGFAHASEALVGKAVGANDQWQFKRALATTGFWSLLLSVIFSAVFLFGQPIIVTAFTDITEVASELHHIYGWILVLPLISVWAYWLDGVYIGAGATRTMLVSMLISCSLIFFPLWWLLQDWGNHGLWLAFTGFNLTRGLTLALQVKRFFPRTENQLQLKQ
jgi:MATE family, multidrug efflux pump